MAKTYYPMTKFNFLVTLSSGAGATAAFTEISGIDANVEVIEFRQGNAASLAPVKLAGLVKHSNLTLKYGLTKDSAFKDWIIECIDERRQTLARQQLTIELIDVSGNTPQEVQEDTKASNVVWIMKNAWVTKYTGPDLNASASEVAIETVEIAYDELEIDTGGENEGPGGPDEGGGTGGTA
jgi:phage tail-like protein